MKNKTNKILVASAVAIMLAPAALNALPQQTVSASATGTVSVATPVYDSTGKANGVTLPSGSQWKLGQQITLNGVAHYQVGNNEYIPASVVTNVIGSANPVDTTAQVGRWSSANTDAGKTVTANKALNVVDVYGNETGKVLPAGSRWVIGEILHANKMLYYQVATNEYVNLMDVSFDDQNASDNTSNAADNYVETDGNYGKTGTVTQTVNVVDNNGNDTGITLPVNSQWKLGQAMHHDKQTYYQVATNEWISFANISIANPTTNSDNTDYSGNGSYITNGSGAAGKIGTASTAVNVVNGRGDAIGKTLPAGSKWAIGGETLNFDKQTYYQIATNEFVPTAYIDIDDTANNTNTNTNTNSSVPTAGNGLVGTLTKNEKVYNTSTNSYGQTLPAGSAWKINNLVVNKYGSYWGQISTNEWVWISAVRLNSGLDLKANSYYEPDFAINVVDQ